MACRPAEAWDEKEDDPLGDLQIVVHGNGAARQLQVLLERLEPDGCVEGDPGCAWIAKAPLFLDLLPSEEDETWSGKLEKLEAGDYRLEASASVDGSTFATPAKASVEVRRNLQPTVHLVLREQSLMPARAVPTSPPSSWTCTRWSPAKAPS